jgi:DNA adenine methylase
MDPLTPPLKSRSGKDYLAKQIVSLMPPHRHYVEPFFGSGVVLLARNPDDPLLSLPPYRGVSEVVNDIDGRLTNLWRVLQDPDLFSRFRRVIEATPLARPEWERAHPHQYGKDPVADAVAFFIDCRQSFRGMSQSFTRIARKRTRRGMNRTVSQWLTVVEGLPALHRRLSRVVIESMPAVELIRREDTPDTLFYCDPPHLQDGWVAGNISPFQMTEADHRELLEVLRGCRGKVMLSGRWSDVYADGLDGWERFAYDLPTGTAKSRQTEVIWCNFLPPILEGT